MASDPHCLLCSETGGELLWQDDCCRVVHVGDGRYPGFCRVILQRHVREMTDLDENERSRVMTVVWKVEAVLRDVLQPDKINLASLGNVVPHLHWHVIPRFADDCHFPDAIWSAARREGAIRTLDVGVLKVRLAM